VWTYFEFCEKRHENFWHLYVYFVFFLCTTAVRQCVQFHTMWRWLLEFLVWVMGNSVSLDGDYALVGARFDDVLGYESGAAYIFKFSNGIWAQESKLIAIDGHSMSRNSFCSYQVIFFFFFSKYLIAHVSRNIWSISAKHQ